MSPPRNYPIPDQDGNIIITQKYPITTPILEKGSTVYKIFLIIYIFQIKRKKKIIIL